MSTLTVGAGKEYSTISAAVAASHNADVIQVQAGTYTNDFSTITDSITIECVGGMVNVVATVPPPNLKGIFTVGSGPGNEPTVTLQDLEISGAAIPDVDGGNGAGVRYQSGHLTINNSYIYDNQDGLLGNPDAAGSILIESSEFAYNGSGTGFTHNIYVGDIATLFIKNSYIHDASVGHEIKSRAESTTINGTRIFDNNSTASYSIDLPNGGKASFGNDRIEQGPNTQNPAIISYGEEGSLHSGTSVLISGTTIVNDDSSGSSRAVVNDAPTPVIFQNNSVWGLTSGQIASGPATISGTTFLAQRPKLNMNHPWKAPAASTSATAGAASDPGTGTPGSGLTGPAVTGSSVAGSITDPNGSATAPVTSTITVAATDANPVELVSSQTISATAGDHMIFVGGTGDAVTATGGSETVQAFHGGNRITTGSGNDTISYAGRGNTIDSGSGSNVLQDSGSDNTIVMPGAGHGFDDVFGYVLQNGDTLDFTAALAGTAWNGSQASLGDFLHVSESGANAMLSISATADGSAVAVAKLEGAGDVSLATLLAHATL